jgi:hypothetical protein
MRAAPIKFVGCKSAEHFAEYEAREEQRQKEALDRFYKLNARPKRICLTKREANYLLIGVLIVSLALGLGFWWALTSLIDFLADTSTLGAVAVLFGLWLGLGLIFALVWGQFCRAGRGE